ncbi:MAG: DUF1801 domain-containing protein [Chitinophagaceae bacterium]
MKIITMAELKTKATEQTVESFIEKIADEKIQKDCHGLIKLMKKATGSKPKMWGSSIIGFGQYHYKYDSGHEGDMCITGFSPRKANLSLYIMGGIKGQEELLKKLGKHKASKGCVYIKKLEDVDLKVLESMVKNAVDYIKKKYPAK